MCPQASIYDDASLYGSGYSSRAVSPPNVCQKTLPQGLISDQFPCWSSVPSIHSPPNTAGTPLELAPPAAALWWALSPCMSANISHTRTHAHARSRPHLLLTSPSSGPGFPFEGTELKSVMKSGNDNVPLQLRCYNLILSDVPAGGALLILVFNCMKWMFLCGDSRVIT